MLTRFTSLRGAFAAAALAALLGGLADPVAAQDDTLDVVTQNPDVDTTGALVLYPAESVTCDAVCQGMLVNSPAWTDSDGDGLTDADEALYTANPRLPDTDADGLLDGDEIHIYTTFPWDADSDQDLVGDYREIFESGTNPRASDSDYDGYSDGEELDRYFTNPNDYESYPFSQGKRQ